jgi:hypothetical protein
MSPVLVPCLVALRTEFNLLARKRDKGADGWIGDKAHQAESSDHNPDDTPGSRTPYTDPDKIPEVHALDVDKDLGAGLDLDDYVHPIVDRHRAGLDDRLQNVIWRGRIASRSWGWTWIPYSGASKHFDHAHFSARYTTPQENDTSPWGVWEDTMTEAQLLAALESPRGQATLRKAALAAVEAAMSTDKLGHAAEVTRDQALQNTEAATRNLPAKLAAIAAAVGAPSGSAG